MKREKQGKRRSDPRAARASALAGELRVAIGRLSRRLREQTRRGGLTLTWSQQSVLNRLDRDGPTTVTVLARAEGVRPQSMGATISVLQGADLVAGTADPADGRQIILTLTAAGREMVRAGRAAREGWLFHAIQSELTSGEQETLASCAELLERLARS
jgi:DNA-binding MarR family transcriptional regulator